MDMKDEVFRLLLQIPKDRVTTYAELARAAGTHPRAVASFMRCNKDPLAIPCFRVVRSDGAIGGYSAAGGISRKKQLLEAHGIRAVDGKVDLEAFLHRFP